jgi:hypothetical protein
MHGIPQMNVAAIPSRGRCNALGVRQAIRVIVDFRLVAEATLARTEISASARLECRLAIPSRDFFGTRGRIDLLLQSGLISGYVAFTIHIRRVKRNEGRGRNDRTVSQPSPGREASS